MLTSEYEEIRMAKDESFDEFYLELNDILNSMFDLGEIIEEPGIFRRSWDPYLSVSILRLQPLKNVSTYTLLG